MKNDKWNLLTPMRDPIENVGAALFEETKEIFLFGGYKERDKVRDSDEIWSYEGNKIGKMMQKGRFRNSGYSD